LIPMPTRHHVPHAAWPEPSRRPWCEPGRRSWLAPLLAGWLLILLIPLACSAKQEHLIEGRTMGTTYHVKVVTGPFQNISGLKAKIEKRLAEINRSMSTYIRDSEISRFNQFRQANVKFEISPDFYEVMKAAEKIFRLSQGAWDGTVDPLVNLWGFGRTDRKNKIPSKQEISEHLADIGFDNIEVFASGFLVKKRASATLDLSSIAKGYGVDQVAEVIRTAGFEDYLVEIGGDIFASGYRTDGKSWRVGINRPRKDAAFDDVYKVVSLHNRALATSGDYRNFFEAGGVRYSHVINPKSGYPVSNGVVSVSILADQCTFADGLATAVMVLGAEKGLELINRLDGVEGLIVVEKRDGSLLDYVSTDFQVENPLPSNNQ
jgi:thiamine biosynthesis lipoprotein